MKLNKNQLNELCQIALLAAKTAGLLIAEYHGRDIAIEHKQGASSLASEVLTEVDTLSQEIILNALLPTCEVYDLALLSEELEDDRSRFEKDYFWCIDPLDGTLAFLSSTSGFAVSIALVSREGVPMIGVVYDPVEDVLYHAIKGEGVFRNKKAWKKTKQSENFTLINDRSFKNSSKFDQCMEAFNESTELKTILHGGAVMNAIWVLENSPACYFKFPRKDDGGGSLWDYAATTCIFEAIGGVVSDFYEMNLELNRVESTKINHLGVLFASDRNVGIETLRALESIQGE